MVHAAENLWEFSKRLIDFLLASCVPEEKIKTNSVLLVCKMVLVQLTLACSVVSVSIKHATNGICILHAALITFCLLIQVFL